MYKLLIVDDEKPNLRLLERLFASDYECFTASSGSEAIELLQRHDIAVLLTDQRMPQMTGIELLKQTAELRPHMVRILLTGYTDVEALVEAINSGLVYMYVTKPWNNSDLKHIINRGVEHYENNKRRHVLERTNERLTMQLGDMKQSFVDAFAETLRTRDEDAYNHAMRVSKYSDAIGKVLGLDDPEQMELSSAALLHNLGHLGTPDRILTETTKHPDRGKMCESHSERGASIIRSVSELSELAEIVRSQGENFDGTGYPRALLGEQIPLGARIVRVADEYDLLTTEGDLSRVTTQEAARENIRLRAGKDFDPKVVNALLQVSNQMGPDEFMVEPALRYA